MERMQVVGWLLVLVGLLLIARALIGVAFGILRGVLRLAMLLVTGMLGLGLLWAGLTLTHLLMVVPL
jgi:hypothetical protein